MLTPMQDLMMEVLVARTRLGHQIWTFTRNRAATKAAMRLQALGLLTLMNGIVENTFRVSITSKGLSEYGVVDYVPPILGGPQ